MIKGIIIMLIVFVGVAILGWGMNKLDKVPEAGKQQFLEYYLVGSGIFGIAMCIERFGFLNYFDVLSIIEGLLGLFLLLAGIFGKFGSASKSTSFCLLGQAKHSKLKNSSILYLKSLCPQLL